MIYELTNLDPFIKKVLGRGGSADQVIKKICIDMFSSVVYMSPVDTGRFRGNWQCAINNAPVGTLATVDRSGGGTVGRINAQVQKGKFGDTFFLVNNLPYARALEYGHSKQAPAGMVRVTLARFQAFVDRAAKQQQAKP